MFSFPPFESGSVFTSTEVRTGVELVLPTHSHATTESVATTRNFHFRLALHPYSEILNNAATTNNISVFGRAIRQEFGVLLQQKEDFYKARRQARGFDPIAIGRLWMSARGSLLVHALQDLPEAKARTEAITNMLQDAGMLQEDTLDNEAGVCEVGYYKMLEDLSVLLGMVSKQLDDGKPDHSLSGFKIF